MGNANVNEYLRQLIERIERRIDGVPKEVDAQFEVLKKFYGASEREVREMVYSEVDGVEAEVVVYRFLTEDCGFDAFIVKQHSEMDHLGIDIVVNWWGQKLITIQVKANARSINVNNYDQLDKYDAIVDMIVIRDRVGRLERVEIVDLLNGERKFKVMDLDEFMVYLNDDNFGWCGKLNEVLA